MPPTDRERAYWERIGAAKREPVQMTPEERTEAGPAMMETINELRRSWGLAPFERADPPDELAFYARARELGFLD